MLKKSSSPRVSSMEETVCLAIVSLRPFMLPLTSTRITTSFGEVAAWIYHFRFRQSKAITPCSSGFHLIPLRMPQIKQMNNEMLKYWSTQKKKGIKKGGPRSHFFKQPLGFCTKTYSFSITVEFKVALKIHLPLQYHAM